MSSVIGNAKPSRDASLTQWLNWLLALHAQEIDLGLSRVKQVAEKLGLLNPQVPVITVAGTNGKGSSVAFLSAIYQQAGYQVGCYTSPHLLRFNERIQVNGQSVADQVIIDAFDLIESQRGEIKLTYFEFSTLAALQVFSQNPLDVIVLEVGLGGRLDAVNIIDADLALITTIDVDHVDWLGSDREQIALEKAGILRAGKPAVCADPKVPQSLLAYAQMLGASLSWIGRDFNFEIMPDLVAKNNPACLFMSPQGAEMALPKLSLQGDFQYQNAAGVLAAIELLQARLPVSSQAIHNGLQAAVHPGRLQWLKKPEQDWLIDVAHNPQSAQVLADYLQQAGLMFEQVVFSALNDKDMLPMILAIKPFVKHWCIADLNVPRATSLEGLQALLEKAGVSKEVVGSFESIAQAVASVERRGHFCKSPQVLVFGSFYTVSQALEALL